MSSNETKLKIIETAKNLLLSDNTQGLSIRKICASSKISYGSFYHHMKSKENLMLLIRKNVVEEGMAEFLKKTENKTPLEKIIILSTIGTGLKFGERGLADYIDPNTRLVLYFIDPEMMKGKVDFVRI